MTQNISGFGAVVSIVASNTFPSGLAITQFSDDADPLAIGAIAIAESAMGLNGDLIIWSKAQPLPVVINVIPDSDDDINLGILFSANRVGKGKASAQDSITLTASYADGTTKTFINGAPLNAEFGISIASAGRMKTKAYGFTFENIIGN
jgi:hypothetical protein